MSLLGRLKKLAVNHRPFSEIARDVSADNDPDPKLDESNFLAIRKVAREQLLRTPLMVTFVADLFYELAQFLILHLTHSPEFRFRLEMYLLRMLKSAELNFWPNACLALGLITSHIVMNDEKDLAVLEKFCNRVIDPRGTFRRGVVIVDQCMIGYSLLELFERTKNKRYQIAADELAKFLLHEHPRSRTQTLPYRSSRTNFMLIDTLAMICPFLARYGERFNVPDAMRLAERQLIEFLEEGIDAKTGLPFHAYEDGGEGTFGILGWTRGIGWLAIGLADTLAHLPQEHEAYGKLAEGLRSLIQALAPYQKEEGCWSWALSIPHSRIDTSGTAMIAYAIERGIQLGVLEPSWSRLSSRALSGILRVTNQEGVVGEALGECQGVGKYPRIFAPSPAAQGTTVALYALILQRLR